MAFLCQRNKRNVWKVAIKRNNTREANLFFILKQSRSCAEGIITTAEFLLFRFVHCHLSLSLSSTLLQFPIQPGIPVCRTVYVHTWTSTPPAWLVIRAIPSGLEDASETSSPPPSLTVSWLPFDRDERRIASIEREISAKEVLRMVILWLMIINMGRSCDTSHYARVSRQVYLNELYFTLSR